MIIITHVAFALVSLVYATYVAFVPSPRKLKFVYVLLLGTLTSGVLLSLKQDVNMAQVCISGLAYSGFVLTTIFLAKRKIALIN